VVGLPDPPGKAGSLRPRSVLVIRADADIAMGTGHVMRCLALAQAWQDAGGRVIFAMAEATDAVRARISAEGIESVAIEANAASADDARHTRDLAQCNGADWVVLDGYHFDAGYRGELQRAGQKLLFLDDEGVDGPCSADIILNQNSDTVEEMYPRREPHTRLLLGTRYALLRREFLGWRAQKREIPRSASRLLVTMGGSDPDNLTSTVIQVLSRIKADSLHAMVLAGGSNPHFESLRDAVSNSAGTVRLQASASNMPELMAQADLAIIAGGGTLWELLYMSCPVISFSRNAVQSRILKDLHDRGVVHHLGDPRQVSPAILARTISKLAGSSERRTAMAEAGRQQVDGEGARRVCEVMMRWNRN
jgi:UDP-2,4-diacetamido-2,4,6-trideoxy-beta-L-altropyranose hydrolase